jgi:CBS domain-containing protein
MRTVNQLLASKSTIIFSVDSKTSVLEALQLMMKENISALLIIENDELKGIFTERDYARKVILKGKLSKETAVSEVMTSNMITVKREDSIDHCMKIMTDRHFRHLPVLADNKVIGMVSIGDVVRFIMDHQKKTIEHLENYINS